MSRRIAGLSLDGRYDVAAMDWEEETGIGAVYVLKGGTQADIITTKAARRIAGPQAALAQHGRGGGWGDIGDPRRGNRRPLSAVFDAGGRGPHAEDMVAAIDAIARGAQEIVLAVPDLPSFDEAAQSAILRAIRSKGNLRARLLWRPVAVMLALIQDGVLGENDLGHNFRFLVHSANGIEVQSLTLRRDPENPSHIAPQRDGPGHLIAPEFGLDALFDLATQRIEQGTDLDWGRLERSRLGPKLLVGEALVGELEVLRDSSADWHVLTAPNIDPADLLPQRTHPHQENAEDIKTFLITPLSRPFAEQLAKAIGGKMLLADAELIARGCLQAGRIIERGLPHYFDRLEAIGIAANRDGEPAFVPLIPEGHLVAANREYVSPDFTEFVWPRGKQHTEYYILKGHAEVREWSVSRGVAPTADVPVTLRIRQTPGQSWATLDITARDWEPLSRAPERLDWEGLKPTDSTPEEVLERLRTPPPTIPERVVEPSHIDLWLGADWVGDNGSLHLARLAAETGQVDAQRWAEVLSGGNRNPEDGIYYRRLSSDGELPIGLDPVVQIGLQKMLEVMAQRILNGPAPRDNRPLQALTWSFSVCPEVVQEAIVTALEAHDRQRHHRLLGPTAAIKVLRQGSGRAVCGEALLRRLFVLLVRGELNTDTINALAMALSRRAEAPEALTRAQIDSLLPRLSAELLDLIRRRSFQVRFKNTLSAIAALFRWREREPHALLATNEPAAAALQITLRQATDLLNRPEYQQVRALDQKIKLLKKIEEYLVGKGDPAILRLIEEAD